MTMSLIWVLMIICSVVFSILGGCTEAVSAAAMEGATAGITLSMTLAGSLCLWSGLAKVMEKGGINRILAKILSPILARIYPMTSKDETAMGYLSANISANLLGLGNAATPLGIAATKRMKVLQGSDEAGDELCRLIIMNTASIQLIPSTVAAARAAAGSVSPFDILPAVWVTSLCSVIAGLTAAFFFSKIWRS